MLEPGKKQDASRPSLPIVTGRFLLAVLIGAVGGLAFWALSLPLPFMLGSMVICIAASMAGLPAATPRGARQAMSAVIGVMLGATFTPQTLGLMTGWALPLLSLVIFVFAAAATSVVLLRFVFGYDLRTAWFAGMPGGLVEMVALAEEQGVDIRRIAVIHSLRIALTVFTVPVAVGLITGADLSGTPVDATRITDADADFFLWFPITLAAGIGLGRLLRLPAKNVLGPMLVSAAIHMAGWTDFRLPAELVILAQIVIGAAIGGRFAGTRLRELVSILPAAVCTTGVLIALAALFAVAVGSMFDTSKIALLLAYSPGGFAEMGLVALALGIETAFVATHHITRIALVGLFGGLIFRLFMKRHPGPP